MTNRASRAVRVLAGLLPLGLVVLAPGASAALVGYGSLGVDDYPDKSATSCGTYMWCLNGSYVSSRGFNLRNCTDFAAWRTSTRWSTFRFPTGNGNAAYWKDGALNAGYPAGTTPARGAIAWWGTERGGGTGHVGTVTKVNADGTAAVEEYNGVVPGTYGTRAAVVADGYIYLGVSVPAQRPLADGTYLRVSETGAIYVISGGKPLLSSATAAYASGRTIAQITQVKLNALLSGTSSAYYPPSGSTTTTGTTSGTSGTTTGTTGTTGSTVTTARYQPVTPTRVLDTRASGGAVPAGATRTVRVGGLAGVPTSGVDSVVLNVTSVNPSATGYLTAYASGAARPGTSSLNYAPGRATANQVIAKVGSTGYVNVFSSRTSDVLVDVVGYVPSKGTIRALSPTRLHDTRATGVRVPAGGSVDVPVLGRGGVPTTGVAGVALTATAVDPDGPGWLTAYAAGAARPNTSNTNFAAGQTLAGSVVARVGSGGAVRIYSSAATDLTVDVTGWVPTGSDLVSTTPARTLDTRTGVGAPVGRVPAGGTVKVPVLGRAGVPSTGVKAVAVTVATVGPDGAGYVSAYPSGTNGGGTSMLNVLAGETIRNATLVRVGSDGTITLRASTGTDLVADVMGYVKN